LYSVSLQSSEIGGKGGKNRVNEGRPSNRMKKTCPRAKQKNKHVLGYGTQNCVGASGIRFGAKNSKATVGENFEAEGYCSYILRNWE